MREVREPLPVGSAPESTHAAPRVAVTASQQVVVGQNNLAQTAAALQNFFGTSIGVYQEHQRQKTVLEQEGKKLDGMAFAADVEVEATRRLNDEWKDDPQGLQKVRQYYSEAMSHLTDPDMRAAAMPALLGTQKNLLNQLNAHKIQQNDLAVDQKLLSVFGRELRAGAFQSPDEFGLALDQAELVGRTRREGAALLMQAAAREAVNSGNPELIRQMGEYRVDDIPLRTAHGDLYDRALEAATTKQRQETVKASMEWRAGLKERAMRGELGSGELFRLWKEDPNRFTSSQEVEGLYIQDINAKISRAKQGASESLAFEGKLYLMDKSDKDDYLAERIPQLQKEGWSDTQVAHYLNENRVTYEPWVREMNSLQPVSLQQDGKGNVVVPDAFLNAHDKWITMSNYRGLRQRTVKDQTSRDMLIGYDILTRVKRLSPVEAYNAVVEHVQRKDEFGARNDFSKDHLRQAAKELDSEMLGMDMDQVVQTAGIYRVFGLDPREALEEAAKDLDAVHATINGQRIYSGGEPVPDDMDEVALFAIEDYGTTLNDPDFDPDDYTLMPAVGRGDGAFIIGLKYEGGVGAMPVSPPFLLNGYRDALHEKQDKERVVEANERQQGRVDLQRSIQGRVRGGAKTSGPILQELVTTINGRLEEVNNPERVQPFWEGTSFAEWSYEDVSESSVKSMKQFLEFMNSNQHTKTRGQATDGQ